MASFISVNCAINRSDAEYALACGIKARWHSYSAKAGYCWPHEEAKGKPVALAPVATALHAGSRRGVPGGAGVLVAHLRARKIMQALLHGVMVRLGHE